MLTHLHNTIEMKLKEIVSSNIVLQMSTQVIFNNVIAIQVWY